MRLVAIAAVTVYQSRASLSSDGSNEHSSSGADPVSLLARADSLDDDADRDEEGDEGESETFFGDAVTAVLLGVLRNQAIGDPSGEALSQKTAESERNADEETCQ